MSTNDISINRDKDNDVLYVIKRHIDPNKTVNLTMPFGIARFDKNMSEVVGLIIEEFSMTFKKWVALSDYELMEKFDALIEGINDMHLVPSPSTP